MTPGYIALTWYGMAGPPDLPAPIVNKLSTAIAEIVRQPEVQKRLPPGTLVTGWRCTGFVQDERSATATFVDTSGSALPPQSGDVNSDTAGSRHCRSYSAASEWTPLRVAG